MLFTNCKQKIIDLTKIRWQPLDTAISVYYQKKGSGGVGVIHEIVFVGYLDETKHTIIDSSVTKNFVGFGIVSMQEYLQKKLPQLIPKNSEGYLKVSLYDLAVLSARVNVYLDDMIKEQERDSLLSFIFKREEVAGASFISKDSAMRAMSKEYADFQAILEVSPLPASISVIMKREFAEDENKEASKQLLLKAFPSGIESVNYAQVHAREFEGNALVFHFGN